MARILPIIEQFQSEYKRLEAPKGKKRQTVRSPCLPGQTRNRTTKACREQKRRGRPSTRAPCAPGQTRNRTTKACRDKKKPGRKTKA